eukprot:7245409-Prymnesium_polylepis.1
MTPVKKKSAEQKVSDLQMNWSPKRGISARIRISGAACTLILNGVWIPAAAAAYTAAWTAPCTCSFAGLDYETPRKARAKAMQEVQESKPKAVKRQKGEAMQVIFAPIPVAISLGRSLLGSAMVFSTRAWGRHGE